MTMSSLESLVRIPRLTAGRRLVALQRMRVLVADEAPLHTLMAELDAVIELHENAASQLLRWRSAESDKSMHAHDAQQLDAQVDRHLSAFLGMLRNARVAFEPDSPQYEAAVFLEEEEFPSGVRPITSLPFVDQFVAVDQLLKNLAEPAQADAVQTLSLGDAVARLSTLNAAYGQAVSMRSDTSYDDVLQSNRAAFEALTSWAARVVGALPSWAGPDQEARERIFAPMDAQVEEFRQLRARRAASRRASCHSMATRPSTTRTTQAPPDLAGRWAHAFC